MNTRSLPFVIGFCAALLTPATAPASPSIASAVATAVNVPLVIDGDFAGRRALTHYAPTHVRAAPRGGTLADWHALGPFGGDVTDVASSPTVPTVVLAGIAPGGGGGGTLYRSTDSAAHWTPVAALAFRSVYDIEFNAVGGAFIATDSGVWTSTDDGASWVQHDLGIGPNQQVYDVALDPSDATVVWAGVADASGAQPVNLMRSNDTGVSWSDVTPPHSTPMSGSAIVVDPSDSATVVAVFGGSFGGGEVWVTTDAGTTWNDRTVGLPTNPMRAVDYDGTRLLVGGGQLFGSQYVGLYCSGDLGQNWTRLDDASWPIPVVSAIAVDPHNTQTILASIDGAGVNRSTDGGATWQLGVGGSGVLAAQSLRFAPGSSSELWVGASSLGVYRSSDAGSSFGAASTGIAELGLYSIDTSPLDAGQLAVAFQGNNNGGVLTSADGGATWIAEPVPPTRYSNVRFAPDGTLFALSSGPSSIAPEGLYRRNGDGSWSGLGPDQGSLFESDLDTIRFSTTNASLIFLGGADYGVAGNEDTVWRSADAGTTWVKQLEGTSGDKVTDVEIVPGSSEQNLVAVYDGYQGAQQGGALQSFDGGLSWTPALTGLPAFARFPRLCSSPANPGMVFMSMWDSWSTGAVYRSSDNGDTWTTTGWHGGNVFDIACDQQDMHGLYVAQSAADQVVHSTDQGTTFAPFASGLELAGTPTELAMSRTGAPLLYLAGTHGSYVTARDGAVNDTIFADGFD